MVETQPQLKASAKPRLISFISYLTHDEGSLPGTRCQDLASHKLVKLFNVHVETFCRQILDERHGAALKFKQIVVAVLIIKKVLFIKIF